MTDNAPESAPGAQESQGPPVPATSPASGGQQTSESADALVERAVARLTPVIERAVQSTKDRRFSKLDELIELAEKIKATGAENVRVAREFTEQPVQNPGTVEDPAKVRMQAESEILLKDAGVPFDDPEYAQLVTKYGGKVTRPEDWSPIVRTFTDARKRRAAPPNEAQVTPETRSVSPVGSNEEADAIIQQLANMPMASAWDKPAMAARRALKDKLNKLTGGTRDVGVVTLPEFPV